MSSHMYSHPLPSYEGADSQRAEALFFKNEPGLVKTYTFDREKMIDFYTKVERNDS
jgi:hypothetical protein